MNKQRFVVIIISLIGMIATFFPWYRIAPTDTLSGVMSSGWFTLLMFVIIIILALRKNLQENLTMGISWMMTICSLLVSFVVLWRMIDVWFADEGMFSLGGRMTGLLGNEVSIAYGAWIVVIAGICVPFAAYLFRDKTFRRS
ncbi:MAG: hypothetical protein RR397_07040 [Odoribacter sp.]